MTTPIDMRTAWEDLATPPDRIEVFDPSLLASLPDPAQRLLSRSINPDADLNPVVVIRMSGEIKLKAWMPFRARQVLHVSQGFVWEATVGRRPVVFKGGDTLWRGRGDLNFKLFGLIPVANATGPDVDLSAAGRLAAETVAWAPQGLTPQMGAEWAGIDSTHASVSIPIGDRSIDVIVDVDAEGRLQEVTMMRWGNPESTPWTLHRFGASFDDFIDIGGIRIAAAGTVGWDWGTDNQHEGEFFRFTIESGHLGRG